MPIGQELGVTQCQFLDMVGKRKICASGSSTKSIHIVLTELHWPQELCRFKFAEGETETLRPLAHEATTSIKLRYHDHERPFQKRMC
jgi:hypothetical protein